MKYSLKCTETWMKIALMNGLLSKNDDERSWLRLQLHVQQEHISQVNIKCRS